MSIHKINYIQFVLQLLKINKVVNILESDKKKKKKQMQGEKIYNGTSKAYNCILGCTSILGNDDMILTEELFKG